MCPIQSFILFDQPSPSVSHYFSLCLFMLEWALPFIRAWSIPNAENSVSPSALTLDFRERVITSPCFGFYLAALITVTWLTLGL